MAHDQVFKSIATIELHRNSISQTVPAALGKIGATAGFATTNNTGIVTVPASQTGATFTIPLQLKQGDILTAFGVYAQIESAGNVVTLDADLRFTTLATSDLTDTSLGAITQISKTADYATQASDAKSFTAHTVAAGRNYYVLITVTTNASTDVALQGVGLVTHWR